ncbi:MAG: inositol monophosphatase [Ignavibacteria bacterium RIFOXYB2_FULL_35_12]|nr:MAG: inositol monophosphatase [Ignavibacteria bacterium GWA2_36_19]OGU50996.1 MAG: inositol monophosphatase [Ignavibacteria bacterium GWC2_35_8]OGU58137.1 MAG: inositol monophosphatase [Ignavibacteria bacterium GWF2_35_20]OGU83617.1 MAG: inositol monophosphatase [Ignavibacteria bacterium RIFOXYA2_FULL_35_9]OGU89692.1 MAG: inositol monophosphatase [Ignavibacteria bacterium RIFOXYC12_FULL_35_11]OGU89713.1 MAG: inositol monophosphatase [Ignavibacteria bacterium RIFOXYA12_FULL_35_25]OGU95520.1
MLQDIINISKEAGELIRSRFNTKFALKFKTNESDLVTEVDNVSEKIIVDFIKKKYPTHGIITEEGGTSLSTSEYNWVIDPLDGTVNFAHGLPIFAVSIGVQKNSETIVGIVYDVMQNVVYHAEKNNGSYENGKRIRVNDNSNLRHALLVTGFPYDVRENPENALGKFVAFTKAARGIRRLGSAAIDFCYVAKGVFDGFWEVHLKPWDMCAGKLIVKEAGGLVTDFEGNKIDIFSKRILASNGKIHEAMIKVLKENP